jgi:integrase
LAKLSGSLDLPSVPLKEGGITLRRARFQNGSLQRVRRKSGTEVWEFRWRATEPDGKRIRRSLCLGTTAAHPTKSAAQRATTALRININQEIPNALVQAFTLDMLIDHYRSEELDKKDSNKAYSTRVAYENYIKNYIQPRWGNYLLSDIKTVAVEKWLHELSLANGTKAKIRNIMSALYSHAVRWEFTPRNPICGQATGNGTRGASTGVRQSAERETDPISLPASVIQQAVSRVKLRESTMTLLDAATGLRVSELMGLQWNDLDEQNLLLHVRRAIVLGRVKDCKSRASKKALPLARPLVRLLKAWRGTTPYKAEGDWIFASPDKDGKMPYNSQTLFRRHILPVLRSLGVTEPVGWHTLRRSVASIMIANGENIKVVQRQLRHSTVQITLDAYAQAMMPDQRKAHARIVKMILPNKSTLGAA